jgi:hypothetical protein
MGINIAMDRRQEQAASLREGGRKPRNTRHRKRNKKRKRKEKGVVVETE